MKLSLLIIGATAVLSFDIQAAGKLDPTTSELLKPAIERYHNLCDRGDLEACSRLGWFYSEGLGVDIDEVRALSFLTPACERGIPLACHGLASLYSHPKTELIERDFERGVKLLAKACDNGLLLSCVVLSGRYYRGLGVERSFELSARINAETCAKGSQTACAKLGRDYMDGTGVEQNLARAEDLLTTACNNGEDYGCSNLGLLRSLRSSTGGSDPYYGERVLSEGCENGGSFTCWHLARLYDNGIPGILTDLERAKEDYDRACDRGQVGACIDIAAAQIFSAPSEKDISAELKVLDRYCSDHLWGACYVLARLHYEGDVVVEDKSRALDILERACEGYHSSSCLTLAALYREGASPLKPDHDKAMAYKERGCTYAHPTFNSQWCASE